MMKRTFILSVTAACVGAASLRGDGVEEVGDWQEHYPAEDYGLNIDRRLIEEGDETVEVTRSIEEYFDEFPDLDIMGNVVDDPVEEWDEDYDGPDVPLDGSVKEYSPDSDTTALANTDIMGEVLSDQRDRREAACGQGQTEFKILCKTDNYGYEFSWQLKRSNGSNIASGPPSNTNYGDNSVYSGRWCLAGGDYNFQVRDKAGDGLCSNARYGCGYCKTFLDGQPNGSIQDNSKWSVKTIPVKVIPFSSRIDGTNANNGNGNGNLGNWCTKVRSKMRAPQGTCTLPNGQRGHRVTVNVKVDKYGQETSFAITRGGQVRMKMEAVVSANGQKTVEDCLPAGQYTWTINDLDGICCRHGEGKYTITVDGKKLLDGGAFSKTESHDFQLGYDWVPDMNERDCEWWWAHDYRRRDWHTRCYPGYYCNKSYVPLKWSKPLARDAKIYATKLLQTCDDTGIKHDNTNQGENLAKNKGSGTWGAEYAAEQITKRFTDNEEFWGWSRNAHLTQAMWRASKYMGCGESIKSMGNGKMCRMQVCRYAKAGNCQMGKYNSDIGNNWMIPMMADDTACGPMCPPDQGCYV